MAFLVLCPGCLLRLELPELDAWQVAGTGLICTCVRCGAQLRRDEKGQVVTAEPRDLQLFALRNLDTRAVVRRERQARLSLRLRGWLYFFVGKRVSVTDQHVEVRLWLTRTRVVIPLAHVRGVVVVQHLHLDPPFSMWGTYLAYDQTWMPLAAVSSLDRAIDHASAINVAVYARKPAGDPYRGLVSAVE